MILFQATTSCPNYSWIDITISIGTLVSAVMAITAIIYTAISLKKQQKHNELSTKPIPCYSFNQQRNKLSFELQNNGFGPLLIKSITFQMDKNKNADISTLMENKKYTSISTTSLLKGASVSPNKSQVIFMFEFEDSENGKEDREKVLDFLKKVKFEFTYKNIYEKEFSVSGNLAPFLRII